MLLGPIGMLAQTQPESPTAVLEVRSNSIKGNLRHSYAVGARVKVWQGDSAQPLKGHITAIQDSLIVLNGQSVPLAKVTWLKSAPNWGQWWGGILMYILMLGAGLGGALVIKGMAQKKFHAWWEWTLAGLGLIVMLALIVVLFLVGLLFWAFASNKFEIGDSSRLEVKHPVEVSK
jgi:hypothetical protein